MKKLILILLVLVSLFLIGCGNEEEIIAEFEQMSDEELNELVNLTEETNIAGQAINVPFVLKSGQKCCYSVERPTLINKYARQELIKRNKDWKCC
jgi:uncharacterized lipoprotein NlpE involved in copper resistance